MNIDIDKLLTENQIISGMILLPQMKIILEAFKSTIERNVPGEVVELGCNMGTMSLFLARVLRDAGSNKKLFLYDSFIGLPGKKEQDVNESGEGKEFVPGWMAVDRNVVEENFVKNNLELPRITKGWFKEIPDDEYPNPISFAFFDGDFYDSIMDSFNKVYSKVAEGGIICVHDCGLPSLPGVEIACNEFLADKKVRWEDKEFVRVIYKE